MDSRMIVGLVAGVLLLGILYYEHELEQQEAHVPESAAQGPEALSWLRKNDSESALASNRFGETRDAIIFVQELYRAGAPRVVVPAEAIQKDDVETYADALVVTLPEDAAKRARVWELCARELERMGERAPSETKERYVFLWWD
jgi:hypothetical protein